MMTLAEIEVKLPEGQILNQSLGSVFQGALIREISPEWASSMHEQKVRPYSQYLTVEDGKPLWRIAVLTEDAFDHIMVPVMKLSSLHLEQRNCDISLSNFHILKTGTFKELEEQFWGNSEKIHHIEMNFLTSTSFKTHGTYAIFPEPALLFNTLIRKWNAYSDGSVLGEAHMGEHLAECMEITDYRLHTHPYSLEGRRIRAFRGSIRLGLFKNDVTPRMASMLSSFAEFAGTGMKTAMGMGGTTVEISRYRKE